MITYPTSTPNDPTRLDPGDAPLPTYFNTDGRPVAIGDRGACTVDGGVPGLVFGLYAHTDHPSGLITRWEARIRWPSHTTEVVNAAQLFWVPPEISITLSFTEEWFERLLHTFHPLSPDEKNDLVYMVRTAVADHHQEGSNE